MRGLHGLSVASYCLACCALQQTVHPKTNNWLRTVKHATAASLISFSILGDPSIGLFGQPPAAAALTEEQEVINDAWKVVNLAFVDKNLLISKDWKGERLKAVKNEYKTRTAAYTAAKGMIQVLGDPYTRFLTPNEYDTLAGLARGGTAENVAGVGVEMVYADAKGEDPMVNSVVPGSPAEAAGIKANDVIVSVDGDSAKGKSLDAVAAELRGSVGSNVRVTLKRGSKTVDVLAKRAEIRFQGVTSEMTSVRGQKVGLITIKTFSKDTAHDVEAAVKALEGDGATALLIDLRHNPGGYFPGGIDCAKLFLPPDRTVVSVVDRNGIGDTYSTGDSARPVTALPLALVVDAKTASASEVFSAALQENGRAVLVGAKTFGKAKVQTLNQLFDGSGVAVTISLYSTPQGHDINKIGIPVDAPSDCAYPGPAAACISEAVKL